MALGDARAAVARVEAAAVVDHLDDDGARPRRAPRWPPRTARRGGRCWRRPPGRCGRPRCAGSPRGRRPRRRPGRPRRPATRAARTSARVAAAKPSSSSAIGCRSKIASPQRPHGLAGGRGGRGSPRRPPPARRRRELPRRASSIRPTPDQLLHRAVVDVLGHPPPLVLLGRAPRPRPAPAARPARAAGRPAGARWPAPPRPGRPARPAARGRPRRRASPGRARERDGADGGSRPSAGGTGTATVPRPPQRAPPSAAATAGRSARREHLAVRAVVGGHRDGVLDVAQDERRRRRPAPAGGPATRSCGGRRPRPASGHAPRHLGQGRELAHLAVELARAVLQAREKLAVAQPQGQDLRRSARALRARRRSAPARRAAPAPAAPTVSLPARAGTTTPPSRPLMRQLARPPGQGRRRTASRPASSAATSAGWRSGLSASAGGAEAPAGPRASASAPSAADT